MNELSDIALTRDAFLGGRVQVWQPAQGYRAAMDPVLMAAACPARSGERVLELGCGVGVASLCLMARVPSVEVTGIERQGSYAALALRNATEARAPLHVVEADLAALPHDLRQESFDHVMANPPYYRPAEGTPARDQGREAALREETPLAKWIDTARARLLPKGWLTMIQAAERLPDVLAALDGFGAVSVLPLTPRTGRAAGRVIVRARKGARAPFTLHDPVLIHESQNHRRDGEDFTPLMREVLRNGAPLPPV